MLDLDLEIIIIEDFYESFLLMFVGVLDVIFSIVEYGLIVVDKEVLVKLVIYINFFYGIDKIVLVLGVDSVEDLKGEFVVVLEGGFI